MSISVIGNHGPGFRPQGVFGVGGRHSSVPGSWCAISGQAGDVKAFSSAQVLNGTIEVGIYVQATGAVSLRYSLAGPEETVDVNPTLSAAAPWTAAQTLAANEIKQTEAVIWASVEVTFTEDAILYFYGR